MCFLAHVKHFNKFFVESMKEGRNHCFDNLPGIMVSLDMDLALSWSGFPEMESCLCMGSGSVDKDLLSVFLTTCPDG